MSPPPTPPVSVPDSALLSAPPCTASPADATQWFNQEVHPHGSQLKAHLRNSFPSIRDLDDVVQESYLRVWRAKAVRPIQSAKAFLFKVGRHIALDLVRRDRISPVTIAGDLASLPVLEDRLDAAEILTEQEKISLVGDAIVALPARTRAAIILHKVKGLSQADVARELGCTEKAVEHQIARGVQLCGQYLRQRGYEFF